MHKIITVFLLLLMSWCYAQDKELFNLSYRYAPFKHNDTAMNNQNIDVYLAFPVYKNSNTMIAGTLSYRQTMLNNFSSGFASVLYGSSASMLWLTRLSKKHSVTVFGRYGLYSDMRDVSGEDIRWTAGFKYITIHSDKFSTGFGLGYAKQYFGHQVIPLLEINWQFTDYLKMYGLIPVRPRLEYLISQKSKAGLGINLDISSYRLSEKENASDYMKISQWTGIMYYQYSFLNHWSLYISGGYTGNQRFELFDNSNSTSWTLLTAPLGNKPVPLQIIDRKGVQVQFGIFYHITNSE